MEYATTPAPRRRIFRRLFPWTAALALFVGGGYGVYSYAVPTQGPRPGAAAEFSSSRPAAAHEQIKQLFSSTSAVAPPVDDRYGAATAAAPVLPPAQPQPADEVTTPRSAQAVTSAQNPFSTTPVGGTDDRYGASAPAAPPRPAPIPAEQSSTAKADAPPSAGPSEASTAAQPPEVTRGQEPEADNPLRAAAARRDQAQMTDARAAFSGSPAPPAPKPLALAATPRPAAAGAVNDKSASDKPLAADAAFGAAAVDAGRYASDAARAFAADPQRPPAAMAAAEPQPLASAPAPAEASPAAMPVADSSPAAAASEPPLASSTPTFADEASAVQAAPAAPRASAALSPSPYNRAQLPEDLADDVQASSSNPLVPSDAAAEITPTPGIATIDGVGRPGERILEGLQSPAIAIQKLAPAEIQVGKKCTFAVRVRNNGQRTAHNVQVLDEVPQGAQLVGAAPKADVSGAQVIWNLGSLSAGEERIVEMELLPTDEGELGSVATVTFSAQASAKVRCTRPQLALRLTSAPRVMIGQQHVVEIEVSNPGSGDATGVMLLESVPAGVLHEAGPALEFPVGTLHPGQTQRLDLVLTAEQAGRIHNVMTARADANLEVQAACDFEVVAPDLKVSVAGPKQRYLERPATYTVSIDNPGTASAKDIDIITQLPPGLQFVSANNMGEYDAATHSVHWSLAELPANQQGVVELTALPVQAGEHTLQVASRADQGLEDRAEAQVVVEGLVVLSFEVAAAEGAIGVGSETTYEITVANQGSKPAANVQVVAAIPPGLRATNGGGASRHVVHDDRVVFAPLAQLAPKSEAKFRVQVQGLRPGDQRTKIMVTADEVQNPITKEQRTLVYADQ